MKIAIFEDSFQDLKRRYGGLVENYELLIHFYGFDYNPKNTIWSPTLGKRIPMFEFMLREDGFKEFSITEDFPRTLREIPQADLYFTDGLEGDCFSLLELLPADRSFAYTNNPRIRDRLCAEGKTVLEYEWDLARVMGQVRKRIR